MKIKQKWICVILVIAIAISAVAFILTSLSLFNSTTDNDAMQTTESSTNSKTHIAVSIVETDETWVTTLLTDIRNNLEGMDIELIYHQPENYTSAWQENDLMNYLNSDIDYLVLLPSAKNNINDIIKKFKQKGISVILISDDLDDYTDYTAGIEIDFQEAGRLCASKIAELSGDEEYKVVELTESKDSVISNQISRGFESEIKKYTNIQVITKGNGGGNITTAQAVMEDIIKSKGLNGFNVVFSCNSEGGLGAMRALKLAGVMSTDQYTLISASDNQDINKAIIADQFTCALHYDRNPGEVIAEQIKESEEGTSATPANQEIGYTLIDKSNAMQYLSET